MEGWAGLTGADAPKGPWTVLEVVSKILAPAHGGREKFGTIQCQDLLRALGMVFNSGKDILGLMGESQLKFLCQLLGALKDELAKDIHIPAVLRPKGKPDLSLSRRRAESLFAHFHTDNGAHRHPCISGRVGKVRQSAQESPHRRGRGAAMFRISGVSSLALEGEGQPLGGTSKGPGPGVDLPKRIAWEVVSAVNFPNLLPAKELQTALRPLTGLLGGLEEQKDIAAQGFTFQCQRRSAESRRVTVVAAEVGG